MFTAVYGRNDFLICNVLINNRSIYVLLRVFMTNCREI